MNEHLEELRDFYTNFGLTVYVAQLFEFDALTLLLYLKRLDAPFSPPKHLKDLEQQLRKKTLGLLLNKVSDKIDLDEQSQSILFQSLRDRNYLLHHFVTEHAVEISLPECRARISAQLDNFREVFKAADEICRDLCNGMREILGIGLDDIRRDLKVLQDAAIRKQRVK